MENNKGVTSQMLKELADKNVILKNVKWKPDKLNDGYRLFFPYLSGHFVKRRLIEVLGVQNLQFMLEKDEEYFAKGSIGIFCNSDWNFYSAIGVEKEAKNISDNEKKNKIKFKGNVTDTIKSCAEWLGLMLPIGVEKKTLREENKIVMKKDGEKIGHIINDLDKINNYLNGISNTKFLISKIYQINKEKFDKNKELLENLKTLLNTLENERL